MPRSTSIEALKEASDSLLTCFCAAQAERMTGVYRAGAGSEEAAWAESSLDAVWRVAAGESDSDSCAEALEEMMESAEAEEAPDDGPPFYAARALDLVGLALESTLRPDFAKVQLAADTAESVLGSFDFSFSGAKAVVTRFGAPPPAPGPLVSRQLAEDARFFEIVQRHGLLTAVAVPSPVVAELRRASREVGEVYTQAMIDIMS